MAREPGAGEGGELLDAIDVISPWTAAPGADPPAAGKGASRGAALLAMVAGQDHATVGNFRLAFLLIAVVPLVSTIGFLRRLDEDDGSELSGHEAHHPATR
jgi:hypothetical protein